MLTLATPPRHFRRENELQVQMRKMSLQVKEKTEVFIEKEIECDSPYFTLRALMSKWTPIFALT